MAEQQPEKRKYSKVEGSVCVLSAIEQKQVRRYRMSFPNIGKISGTARNRKQALAL